MMKQKGFIEEAIICTASVLAVVTVLLLLVGESRCLKAGYAEFKMDVFFNRYCIERDYRGAMRSIPINEATNKVVQE